MTTSVAPILHITPIGWIYLDGEFVGVAQLLDPTAFYERTVGKAKPEAKLPVDFKPSLVPDSLEDWCRSDDAA